MSIRPPDDERVVWTRRLFSNPYVVRALVALAIAFCVYRAWSSGCLLSVACLVK
jgi:hypothetical protein